MEKLEKLMELVKKELENVGEKGLTSANLESTYKLVDILKDLTEIKTESSGGGGEYGRRGYGRGGYNEGGYGEGGYNEGGYGRGGYSEGGYGRGGYNGPYMEGDYGARGGGGRSYNGYDPRMKERINRVVDGAEMYEYGRDRYQHGGSREAMEEGLEKMMYAICMLVETAMDAAQSPKEKEIIRKHVQKIHNI